jgi:alpha-L-fucosidase 2
MNTTTTFFHDAPAGGDWNRAFPIGNGRLGAMVFGEVDDERMALNDDTLYSGGPRDRSNPDALPNLERIRGLVFEGRLAEAERLNREALTGLPPIMRHYEPLGDVLIGQTYPESAYRDQESPSQSEDIALGRARKAHFENYRKTLDLKRAVAATEFDAGGVWFRREYIASFPDDLIILRFTASRPGALALQIRIERGDRAQYSTRWFDSVAALTGDRLVMDGRTGGRRGIRFAAGVRAVAAGGFVETLGESLFVREADEALLFIAGHTSERVEDPAASVVASLDADRSWPDLLERHVADIQPLFDRVSLTLDGDDGEADIPIDRRLAALAEGGTDAALEALYFNFGRYLLIACSRPGSRAANLQGIWNDSFSPAWGSKYTININIEMNYWPAEVCALPECHEPLFDLIAGLRESGRETAKRMYGCRGFVCHHNTDNTFDTWPTDRNITASYWPMGAAWLSLHLWEHVRFTGDRAFLERALPLLSEAALFFADFLVEDAEGRLVTCPSVSPENAYRLPSGEIGTICAGPTMDNAILYELFSAVVEASSMLGVEPEADFAALRDRLPPLRIGKSGQIMEWADDWDEVEPGHRHISHLFALHPGGQIDPVETPELSDAARETLRRRLAYGGGHTGWSRAWIINFFARLHDGEQAYGNYRALLAKSTLPNLFDDHPPFQIDGNFGGTAGVAEMLLQSHRGRIDLLPALPSAWPSGRVRGLRARGGIEADLAWKDGRLAEATLRADRDTSIAIRADGRTHSAELRAGEPYVIREDSA